MSKLLALDQASITTGYAILDNGKLVVASHFTVRDKDSAQRLVKIRQHVINLIQEYRVDEVVMEEIQLEENRVNNVQTFKVLAEVYGVIQETVTEMRLPLRSVYASSWKSGVGIPKTRRETEKKAAQRIVQEQFHTTPTEDEADAVCIALYSWNTQTQTFDWTK